MPRGRYTDKVPHRDGTPIRITTRQKDVLIHLAAARSNEEIAAALGTSLQAIEEYKRLLAISLGYSGQGASRKLTVHAARQFPDVPISA